MAKKNSYGKSYTVKDLRAHTQNIVIHMKQINETINVYFRDSEKMETGYYRKSNGNKICDPKKKKI